jgi:hypothetical protein
MAICLDKNSELRRVIWEKVGESEKWGYRNRQVGFGSGNLVKTSDPTQLE